ncbi:MAG: hypothetical protein WB493_09840 [Anaeromyxobacteraceae bacterium]
MIRFTALGIAALVAVMPAAAHAQTTTTAEAVVEKNTVVVVKEAPKPSPVTFTPYGFFVMNALFNDAFGNRNYPLPALCSTGAACEGNFLIDVRQSRIGARLAFNDTAGWTKAVLSALIEVDFNGGYAGAVPTGTVGFYNPVVRLRKAYMDATWGTESRLVLRVGQDDILVSPLRATSLAYTANSLFQFAGVMNGRAPQLQVRYEMAPKDGFAFSAVAGALNPQDNTAGDTNVPVSPSQAVDLGAGNRSRMPAFQGRLSAGLRTGGKKLVDVGIWGGWQKNRFVSPATDTTMDIASYTYGADLTLNLWLFQVLGNIYKGNGFDAAGTLGASQGIAVSVARATPTSPYAITGLNAVPATSGWFQVLFGPSDLAQVYGGWGGTQSPFNAYTGSLLAVNATRVQNYMWAAGLIGYAGKNWRFSAEYARATSWFYTGNSYSQGQFSLNSMIVF